MLSVHLKQRKQQKKNYNQKTLKKEQDWEYFISYSGKTKTVSNRNMTVNTVSCTVVNSQHLEEPG